MSGDFDKYKAVGMDAMLSKPFSQADLMRELEFYIIERKRQKRMLPSSEGTESDLCTQCGD